jgi:formylglycine-generating enzyme required for sulfatase activity
MNAYGFIVGIETYGPHGWDIEGPCSNAIAIAQWMLSLGVPGSNIYLFVAAKRDVTQQIANLKSIGVSVQDGANYSQIETFWRHTLPGLRANKSRLLAYWCGHGCTSNNGNRIFFCADYGVNLPGFVFNASNFQRFLRSGNYRGFSDQLFIADVCGVYSRLPLRDLIESPNDQLPAHQLTIYATREGKFARQRDERGVFTSKALQLLSRESVWPDHVRFSEELKRMLGDIGEEPFRIRIESDDQIWEGLTAGIDAQSFTWPPEEDPNRAPYRGLLPLEAEDAGIFFGRDAPTVEALEIMRVMREGSPPRLLAILGASGAGKSSFLRAGLYPRLARDESNFLPLPVIRAEQAAISGKTGLLVALERALADRGILTTRAKLREAVDGGAARVALLLQSLVDKAISSSSNSLVKHKPPTLVLSIDQSEELFRTDGRKEAEKLLALLRDLLLGDAPALIVIWTMRSDSYWQLQEEELLHAITKTPFDLSPMPRGSFSEVIKGPARRLRNTARSISIEDGLVDAVLSDIEAGGAKDALPLLAFTMERLNVEHGGDGDLTIVEYQSLGGLKGSIEAAVEQALKVADADPAIPKDHVTRLALLRKGFIPGLADIDPDTGVSQRGIVCWSQIPAEAQPLIQCLVDQHLLATDVSRVNSEKTVEPAHEALLRQWGLLAGWLAEDARLLAVLHAIKRASREWEANGRGATWLTHRADRLAAAERFVTQSHLAANLNQAERDYVASCRKAEDSAKLGRRISQGAAYGSLMAIIIGLVGWINQPFIEAQWRWWTSERQFVSRDIWPFVLKPAAEQVLKPGETFRECAPEQPGADYCPDMVVIPSGQFVMGSSLIDNNGYDNERPQHTVSIANSFATSKFEVTFAEWEACVDGGGCGGYRPTEDWGGGKQPVIYVSWDDAKQYVGWLSKMTGQTYRLMTEAEYEYATRAHTETIYPWGDKIRPDNIAMANCRGCGSRWDGKQPAPVGSFNEAGFAGTFPPNKFGLYDMIGNVWQWVEDCYHQSYQIDLQESSEIAPGDGSAWASDNCSSRVVRGGSWFSTRQAASARRAEVGAPPTLRDLDVGFRVARTLLPPKP